MKNIQAIKIGNTINYSIDGVLKKKVCDNSQTADELFKALLLAKESPTEENILAVKSLVNERMKIAYIANLEIDVETGEVFMAGFNTPLPSTLIDIIKEYHEKGFPLNPIENFWTLLMLNPDVRVRESLFKFIQTHDFSLTSNGYMIVYKAVYYKTEEEKNKNTELVEYVTNKYFHLKKEWKSNPMKYTVYQNNETSEYHITKTDVINTWDIYDRDVTIIGVLGELFVTLTDAENSSSDTPLYTDMYSRTMTIELGKPVVMERKECNGDPSMECSYGLHVGATKYVQNFADRNSPILVCLVNPMNVVAVPNYDNSKMRVSEYFPYAVATFENGVIDIVRDEYYEDDYINIEKETLLKMAEKIKNNETPIKSAMTAEDENRKLSELQKIIDSRLINM